MIGVWKRIDGKGIMVIEEVLKYPIFASRLGMLTPISFNDRCGKVKFSMAEGTVDPGLSWISSLQYHRGRVFLPVMVQNMELCRRYALFFYAVGYEMRSGAATAVVLDSNDALNNFWLEERGLHVGLEVSDDYYYERIEASDAYS